MLNATSVRPTNRFESIWIIASAPAAISNGKRDARRSRKRRSTLHSHPTTSVPASDVNFYPSTNGTCVPLDGMNLSRSSEPNECHFASTYKVSSGYRRIPGNTCVGGLALADPIEMPCRK
jgi:hypothetical protein